MSDVAVFDCMIFVQAVLSESGPAFKCLFLVEQKRLQLLFSPSIIMELEDVLARPRLRSRFPILTDTRVDTFIAKFKNIGLLTPDAPKIFSLPRDPDDEIYINLAIAGKARYLVTWNERHLTYLMRQDTPEGSDFCARFPDIQILSPPEFLRELGEIR